MRFVVDTNLLISAILKPLSIPARALDVAREKGKICFSDKTYAEATEVLSRSKFDKYLSKSKRVEKLQFILEQGELISEEPISVLACRDPKDNKFLELAVAADVSCIITGDKDLLELHPFRNIPILSPSEFLNTSF